MKKNVIFFLVGTMLTFTLSNFFLTKKYSQKVKNVRDELRSEQIEKAYLERNFHHNVKLDRDIYNESKGNKYLVYYSGSSCYVCFERLLIILRKEYNIVDEIQIVADDSLKINNIKNYNDSFDQKLNFIIDTISRFNDLNEILLLRLDKNKPDFALEFNPNEEELFKRYFEKSIYYDLND
ncbi:hypothetical protein [Roseivirga sp. UBA838]|uniref:hypothetical protein n=1 Tax=Roseivirga sp. UBA838 TaxID=1947393 RepID=UPI00257CF72A|nr:hypothetical protein [Roseivirga sp. UBA838]|tara:strand:+ start:32920 stop:33459 length:540 start_codon:yes stop_codon:yes gene_type:complete